MQEYFKRTQSYWFPSAEIDITTICVTYLSFNVFERGLCQTDNEFEERLRLNPFFEYAAKNWGYHARNASILNQELSQASLNFLENEAKVAASSQALFAVKEFSTYSQKVLQEISGLHLIAYFGVRVVAKLLLNTGMINVDSKDYYGRTPLWWAVENGHEAVVKLLLDIGKADVNVNAKDARNRTPLSLAAENGYEAVVKLLLDIGKADVNAKDARNRTPLSLAAKNGHEAVVKLLLDIGKADVNAKDYLDQTPLSLAAKNGHEVVVKLLLETGQADVDAPDENGHTPLSIAIKRGHWPIVKLLQEYKQNRR